MNGENDLLDLRDSLIILSSDVHQGWSEWSNWSNCNETCFGGISYRNRTCQIPSLKPGESNCAGNATENRYCNLHSCIGK